MLSVCEEVEEGWSEREELEGSGTPRWVPVQGGRQCDSAQGRCGLRGDCEVRVCFVYSDTTPLHSIPSSPGVSQG